MLRRLKTTVCQLGMVLLLKLYPDFSRLDFPLVLCQLHRRLILILASFKVKTPLVTGTNNYQAVQSSAGEAAALVWTSVIDGENLTELFNQQDWCALN